MALASTPPPGQSSSPITKNGETVAVILHDAALDTDPELVAAAGQATLLAIENGRLTAELRSTTTELHATHARIATAGEAERQRLSETSMTGRSNIWSPSSSKLAWPAKSRIQRA